MFVSQARALGRFWANLGLLRHPLPTPMQSRVQPRFVACASSTFLTFAAREVISKHCAVHHIHINYDEPSMNPLISTHIAD